ncbi:DUF7144 family membrane protein [Streptomyces sp. 3N207]|uniref:DUF7144 family membrane protein n=1 Tax=Streptomyces sp. 3N207 TaxID=3457417 RepID=UPI003FCF3949
MSTAANDLVRAAPCAFMARIMGVLVSRLLLIISFLSLPYFQLWAILLIVPHAFIMGALCAYRPETHVGNR